MSLHPTGETTVTTISRTCLELLQHNYGCLNRMYRAGDFEGSVAKVSEWSCDSDPLMKVSVLSDDPDVIAKHKHDTILNDFQVAIDELWVLAQHTENHKDVTGPGRELLLLRCHILIYESKDYVLKVPTELEQKLVNYAEELPTRLPELEPMAAKLNGGPFDNNKDRRAEVIKVQLIAALCGVNVKYRRHNQSEAIRAEELLQRLTNFIENELPDLHQERRKSFGLMGLAWYLKGRILSSRDLFADSRQAFRKSADAYVARLRQKEELLTKKKLTPQQYKEKVSLTIRRTALVTAFGDGYLSFVASRITDALESLILARAALAQNSGLVYITYVDMLYFACLCAQNSSDLERMEVVIEGLRRCRSVFDDLVPGRHYFHRAGLRLATALIYRAQFTDHTDFAEAEKCIEDAIEYAEYVIDDKPRNPHLLSTALVAMSRLLISHSQKKKNGKLEENAPALNQARALAERALKTGLGFIEKELEASLILGEVNICLAELEEQDSELFKEHFSQALHTLRSTLERNQTARNLRIEASCFLHLTRLCLINPNTKVLAYKYFEQWEKIKDTVEHEYCRALARELEPKLGVPFFLVTANDKLTVKGRIDELRRFLNDQALKQFVAEYVGKPDAESMRNQLFEHIHQTLGYGKSQFDIMEKDGLVEKVREMLGGAKQPGNRGIALHEINRRVRATCSSCTQTINFDLSTTEDLLNEDLLNSAARISRLRPDSIKLTLTGLCPNCQGRNHLI